MCALARSEVPFEYVSRDQFSEGLAQWIGQVFYDILPEHGYEIRDEQIFTAFQLGNALCKGKVHFAEAGLGTGKTFAYLLAALPYARFKGKPAVIACATTALQEQLAGPGGDIEILSQILNLDIDARMAKDPCQYICDAKVNRFDYQFEGKPGDMLEKVLCQAGDTNRGERSELPHIPDRVWKQLAWDETMACELCSSRGFCRLVKAREYYRATRDLIVCDHGIFFEDLWTRDERIADGKLPLLPDYSAVVFDEGHKVILPAAMRAGRQLVEDDIDDMLSSIERVQGARTSLLAAFVAMNAAGGRFFKLLHRLAVQDERTARLAVQVSEELIKSANTLRRALRIVHLELQNEQSLHIRSLSETRMHAYESKIERAIEALDMLCRNNGQDTIAWIDRNDGSFWVVPRDLRGLLNKYLFSKDIPVVFSSATLSTGGDFSYFARTLGLTDPSSSSVASPFELDKQVVVYIPEQFPAGDHESWFALSLERLVALLRTFEGRALVLTNSSADVRRLRAGLENHQLPFEVLWEDSAERGHLLRRFREHISSVLVGASFWEGIDVPGEALSLVVIWRLPFPPRDPLIEARRHEAKGQGLDPVITVDYPEMSLKLKQGCGRLIRSRYDRGLIAILEPVLGMPWEQFALAALPAGAKVVHKLDAVTVPNRSNPILVNSETLAFCPAEQRL